MTENILKLIGPHKWFRIWYLVIIILFWEFFASALADSLSLEFEWQQVSSRSPGLFSVFCRFQQCCSLDGLHWSPYFQVLQSLYQFFGNCNKSTNYNWYQRHFHVPQFFQFLSEVQVLIFFFSLSFNFTPWSAKSIIRQILFFCCPSRGLVVWLGLDDLFLS